MPAIKPVFIPLSILAAFVYGFSAAHFRVFPYPQLRTAAWSTREFARETGRRLIALPSAAPIDRDMQFQLEALGYLQGYQQAPDRVGVLLHERSRSSQGLNLYVSGHAPAAFLMGMDGTILHEWRLDYERACPHRHDKYSKYQSSWVRARLLKNGDLVALYNYNGLVRLDRNSEIRWALCGPYHHDLAVDEQQRIYTIRTDPRRHPRISRLHEFQDDSVAIIGPDGKPLHLISIFDALRTSAYAPHLRMINQEVLADTGDIFHTNAVKVIDGRSVQKLPALARHALMISIRELDTVAVLDPEKKQIVWALSGAWQRQHEPVPLDNGNILVFDNQSNEHWSNVLEIDPSTQRLVWAYRGNENNRFRSTCCGTNQRLSNGNTLVTSSEQGMSFELTADNEVVWHFVNPDRAGEGRLIATIFDLQRLAPDTAIDWLDSRSPQMSDSAMSALAAEAVSFAVGPVPGGGSG